MKIVFMGTPDFSVPALEALVAAGHEVLAVYSQPPRPAGRGKKDRPGAVHQRADELGLPVRVPTSLRNVAAQAEFAALNADVAVVVAYGLILPPEILVASRLGCVNIHASLLPRWRGAAPIHRAVMAGDAETGICTMAMDEGLDTGDVLLHRKIAISDEDTTGILHDRLAQFGADLIVETLEKLEEITPEVQSEQGVTYAKKVEKSEARIDWSKPAVVVDRQIRGLAPFPGAWCEIAGERVKLLGSRIANGGGKPGQIVKDFTIACGEGAVEITRAQRPVKWTMDADQWLRQIWVCRIGWTSPHLKKFDANTYVVR